MSKKDSISKKEAILRSAQEVFGEYGYSGTTMKMVADKAGVAFGLVFHYYKSKENLFLTAGFDLVDSLFEKVMTEIKQTDTGLDNVRTFVQVYFEFTQQETSRFKILIRCSPYSDGEPQIDKAPIAEKFREFIEDLQYFIIRGMRDGTIRDLPVEETAFLIYSTMVGAIRTTVLAPFQLTNIYDEALEFIIRSIETTSDKKPLPRTTRLYRKHQD
ncbi:TetR/AcrR family transcriptional regulator [Desulfovibrio inopinatus]|uniref:TetR/AcrR family transcriptional regulator n=1 Tax=Desulfovibrio inopinatus TaxID=102109 RepID=UPI00040A1D29|nr:TetR/AcrR family transcriptional regulator [Desulfovibrio inopinatus]